MHYEKLKIFILATIFCTFLDHLENFCKCFWIATCTFNHYVTEWGKAGPAEQHNILYKIWNCCQALGICDETMEQLVSEEHYDFIAWICSRFQWSSVILFSQNKTVWSFRDKSLKGLRWDPWEEVWNNGCFLCLLLSAQSVETSFLTRSFPSWFW